MRARTASQNATTRGYLKSIANNKGGAMFSLRKRSPICREISRKSFFFHIPEQNISASIFVSPSLLNNQVYGPSAVKISHSIHSQLGEGLRETPYTLHPIPKKCFTTSAPIPLLEPITTILFMYNVSRYSLQKANARAEGCAGAM